MCLLAINIYQMQLNSLIIRQGWYSFFLSHYLSYHFERKTNTIGNWKISQKTYRNLHYNNLHFSHRRKKEIIGKEYRLEDLRNFLLDPAHTGYNSLKPMAKQLNNIIRRQPNAHCLFL